MSLLFLASNRQQMPICAKTVSSWVKKVLSNAKAHVSLGTLQGVVASTVLVAGIFSGVHPAGR